MRQPIQPPRQFKTDRKRYGWWRCFNDFVGHPKWRLVAARSGVHLAFVTVIVQALCQTASKARKRGYIGDAEFEIIAVSTDIPAEQVADVFRVLCDLGWIDQDYIVDWLDRQPDVEDPTAAERQRQKRARDKARRAVATGTATAADLELVGIVERERIAASRVTASPPAPPPPETIKPFAGEDEGAARKWLLGDGSAGYGVASRIVADHYGCNRLNADGMLRRWLKQLGNDARPVAYVVSEAFEHAVTNEAFRNVVESRLAALKRELEAGPPLPLGMTALRGGRSP